MEYGLALRNARLAADEVTIGTAPKLQLRSGTKPSNAGAADAGDLLAEITLPSDWQTTPDAGKADKEGSWSGVGTSAAGAGTTITHFRLKNSAGSVTHIQGSVGVGTGDLQVDNSSIAEDQVVTVTKFERTAGNAGI